jgi:pilus assembly protein Flp/PilA
MLVDHRESGQGLVEYALILVLVFLVVIVILALLGPAIGNVFSNVVSLI